MRRAVRAAAWMAGGLMVFNGLALDAAGFLSGRVSRQLLAAGCLAVAGAVALLYRRFKRVHLEAEQRRLELRDEAHALQEVLREGRK